MKTLPNEYNFLTPFRSPNLSRLGVKKDGGYILDKDLLQKSDFLISFGMAEEYSFEEEFLKLNPKNRLIIFDFSVNHFHYIKELFKNIRRIIKLKRSFKDLSNCIKNYFNFIKFVNNKRVNFYSKKVASQLSSEKEITIKKIFEDLVDQDQKNITFKIDIEGSEYEIFNKILLYEKKIDQLIMEYHDIHLRKEEFFNNMRDIQKYFYITHLHANNYRNYNSDGFPINIEVTLLNRRFFDNNSKKNLNYPINNLDYPNNPDLNDLKFNFNIS